MVKNAYCKIILVKICMSFLGAKLSSLAHEINESTW
jgi:hypothetical protein